MNISFIGSGNLAWHLAPALDNAGYVVKEVYSRNPKHAGSFNRATLSSRSKATLDFSTSVASVFFIATSDDAIENIAREIILPEEAYLFHVSGTQPLSELQYAATVNTGVFYPLQTFTRNKKIDFSTIPLFIESNNEETEKVMIELAKAISNSVKKIGSEERKALHVAAVFASNFSNHMLTLSKKVLEDNGLTFDLVKPLIVETLNKALSMKPEEAQTGPARRGDLETLDKHIEFLKEEKELSAIYKIITQDILDTYQPE